MPRPIRPNPGTHPGRRPNGVEAFKKWQRDLSAYKAQHVKQETAPERRERLQEEAQERQEAWSELSTEEKLRILDSRPGRSQKQRARFAKEASQPAS